MLVPLILLGSILVLGPGAALANDPGDPVVLEDGSLIITNGIACDTPDAERFLTDGEDYWPGTNAYADCKYGQDAEDELFGRGGTDQLLGGDGSDELSGGSKHDHLIGQDGGDTIYGGADNDLIRGMQGDDYMYGQGGNDTLWDGAGADTLSGGPGADHFNLCAGEASGNNTILDYRPKADGDIKTTGLAC